MAPTGLHVPLITPMSDDGTVDLAALENLAHASLADGASGLVALGTTGEPATLTDAEKAAVVDRIGGVCREHGAVFTVGVGGNASAAAAEAVAHLDARADYALVVVPYYTRPSEAGVIEHYRHAAASSVPLIVYDVPYRTCQPLGVDALLTLAEHDGIAAFKHAVGGITETTVRLLAQIPDGVSVLAGDDPFVGAMLGLGAHGAISACANVAAGEFAELAAAWDQLRVREARVIGNTLADLTLSLFAEPNPTVIKGVLAAQGRIPSGAVRAPLLPASAAAVGAALAVLHAAVTV